jgi:hypothetical protein
LFSQNGARLLAESDFGGDDVFRRALGSPLSRHRLLNVKTAQEDVMVSDVLRVVSADYLAGKYRPKIGDKRQGESNSGMAL